MSSTNVNIGLADSRSSRVLKPPGGGHTDIFGAPEPVVRGKSRAPPSQIGDCFKMEAQEKVQKVDDEIKLKGENEENSVPTQEKEIEEKKEIPQPQRIRIPPGGFSSGLW